MTLLDSLNIKLKFKPTALCKGNIILQVTANIDNPTSKSISITKPTVRVYNGESLTANSVSTSEKIKIQPNTVTPIVYEIEVPVAGSGLVNMLTDTIENVLNVWNGKTDKLNINLTVKYYLSFMFLNKTIEQKIEL